MSRTSSFVPAEAGPTISVVVPVLNEAANIDALLARTLAALRGLKLSYELVFVDDGSTDETAALLARGAQDEPAIRCVSLSRNFGHQAALLAGLAHARGQAVITMDGDLQHPPELIARLVELWQGGFEIVQAIRREPADASRTKRAGSRWFYRLLSGVARIRVTAGAADFRLMSRPAVQALLQCGERCRFHRGLVQWIGFRGVEVPYQAAQRHAGRTKYTWRGMVRLAGDAIFSFSTMPLRLAGLAGGLLSFVAAVYLVFVVWVRLFTDIQLVPGWSSILAAVLILGGVNLIVLWILGEYVGRLYEEVKQRPLYIVRAVTPGAETPRPGESKEKRQAEGGLAPSAPDQPVTRTTW